MSRTLLIKITVICLSVIVCIAGAEVMLRVQNFIELDGFREKEVTWNPILHHGSNKFVVADYGANCTDKKIKILLLGDSWMEDPFLANAIGREFSSKSGKCVEAINGGTSSYAPTIYLLKGRQGFKKYGKFDYVIVNIDETDIGDEWLRYRKLVERDASGRVVAVPYAENVRDQYFLNGKIWAENSDFYIGRFLKFYFFYHVLVPSIDNFTDTPSSLADHYASLMQYVMAPDAATSFRPENDYFQGRLLEMVTELSTYTNGASSVYVIHHPHLRGIVDEVEEGKKYQPIVSDALVELGRKSGVKILDARNHVMEIHGEKLFKNTYVDSDPFSHLDSEGATRYGKWIADQISNINHW